MRPTSTAPTPIAESEALARAGRAAQVIDEHGAALRRTARRLSLCSADADDAVQRTAEILLTKAPPLDRGRLLAWAQVVVRREALAVARRRRRDLGPQTAGLRRAPRVSVDADQLPGRGPDPEQALVRRERAAEAARTLQRLKPQERRALALQAAGCSYEEIQAITGWTYTKVNRCLAEGRARLRALAASDCAVPPASEPMRA